MINYTWNWSKTNHTETCPHPFKNSRSTSSRMDYLLKQKQIMIWFKNNVSQTGPCKFCLHWKAAQQHDELNVCAGLVLENQGNDHKLKENRTKKETYKETQYVVQKQFISNVPMLITELSALKCSSTTWWCF